jgi:hypothetical protein
VRGRVDLCQQFGAPLRQERLQQRFAILESVI